MSVRAQAKDKPAPVSFKWDDPFLLDDQLTEDERMIRDTARAYAEDKLAPRIIDAFAHETTDPDIFRENYNYRWFIIARILTRFGLIAEPFYIIYAVEGLGLPAGTAGIYLAVRAVTGGSGSDGRTVLLSGIRPGEQVVVSGTSALKALATAQ